MRVSVIIPCHNAEPYVAQAIGSVLEQTQPVDEIIVIDDGSSDGSRQVIESFGDRVRCLAARMGNAADTRTHGYAHATGDLIMFLDADDVLGPTAVENLTRILAKHPDSVAAVPWYRLIQDDGRWVRRPPSCRRLRPGEDHLQGWLRGWYHPTSSVMWTRQSFERAGGWDARGGNNDDGFLMMRAFVRGIRLRISRGGESFYRRLPQDVQTLSGQRFSHDGLKARIFVVEQIGKDLQKAGRIWRYQRALSDAVRRIENDCTSDQVEMLSLCQKLRGKFRQPVVMQWSNGVAEIAGRAGALLRGSAKRRFPEVADDEVRYGLDVE